MAPGGGDDAQEKTLEPTQKKIDDAKEKGEFPRSREITIVAGFVALLLLLGTGREYMTSRMLYVGRFFFEFNQLRVFITPESMYEFFLQTLWHLIPILMPILAASLVAGLAAEFGQIGFHVKKEPFEPKWNRLDPVAGFKRIFSLQKLMEGAKSVAKLTIFALVVYFTIRGEIPRLARMSAMSLGEGLQVMLSIALKIGIRACIVLAFLGGFDYWFQRWQFFKKLRMSHQEMKDEMKEREGDPMLKSRIRTLQMEIARKRMMSDVPDSDVILTNPTHYAVALRYDPEKGHAPLLVAKGQNYVAKKIREIAAENNVPIVENPPLARAIYKKCDLGQPIPANLFKAVAQILASIYKLARKRGRAWAK